jgi:hypothetical protein
MDRKLAITALLLACGPALAAEDAVQRAQRCAGISDSLERLVCYDGLFRTGQGTSAPAPTMPAAPPVVPAGVTPPAAPATANSDFGADQLRRSAREDEEEARTMTGTVTELRETRRNVFRITLENGQIWQQMDMDSLFHVEVGDTVEINRGRLGGYRMARKSRGGSGWVRVNRLK